MDYTALKNREKTQRIPSGCGVSGIINRKGEIFSGNDIIASICSMKERGNGLGSGYAGYGIYPDFAVNWCFHIMYESQAAREEVEKYLSSHFEVVHAEPIPSSHVKTLKYTPMLFRYFLEIRQEVLNMSMEPMDDSDYILKRVMHINKNHGEACVFSSGKNMGIFKGVGNPDEIAEFYRIDEYKGYIWTAHNRFPTNTVGWWGGAHPFGILDWSVVHNGEISSYGINRRYLENSDYYCTFFTDTEVITYLIDLLIRKHRLDFHVAAAILAPPLWEQIQRAAEENREFLSTMRLIYSSALLNGPFSFIAANSRTMMGLNDRIKLRPLVAAEKDDFVFLASEESAIRLICKDTDSLWMPEAGQPVIVQIASGCEDRKNILKPDKTLQPATENQKLLGDR